MAAFDAKAVVRELKRELDERLAVLEAYPIEAELEEEGDLPTLLKIALKNEAEASEIAAVWMPSTPETDVKLGFARQVGDEARHYRLIADYLRTSGVELEGFDPLAGGYSPLFQALRKLETTVERLSAGQFTREAIAMRRNDMFIAYLERHRYHDVAHIYRESIQPDETHHHQLGVTGLEQLLAGEDDAARARAAMEMTLAIADEMKKAARQRTGAKTLPGC
ncbi:MAG TPA: ferritin-like domain-containing protein [bacterium]|nr:ferritin-like domain-containing protein [bacterium]